LINVSCPYSFANSFNWLLFKVAFLKAMFVNLYTKKTVAPRFATKSFAVEKAFSKSETIKTIAEMVDLGKKQVADTIDALMHIIKSHLSNKGPGVFVFD